MCQNALRYQCTSPTTQMPSDQSSSFLYLILTPNPEHSDLGIVFPRQETKAGYLSCSLSQQSGADSHHQEGGAENTRNLLAIGEEESSL